MDRLSGDSRAAQVAILIMLIVAVLVLLAAILWGVTAKEIPSVQTLCRLRAAQDGPWAQPPNDPWAQPESDGDAHVWYVPLDATPDYQNGDTVAPPGDWDLETC